MAQSTSSIRTLTTGRISTSVAATMGWLSVRRRQRRERGRESLAEWNRPMRESLLPPKTPDPLAWLWLGAAMALVGCGASRTSPVEGTVLLDGKPVAGASIQFIAHEKG